MEKQLHLLTGSYALNSLTNGERSAFERHALNDAETLEEVRSLSETAAMLAFGLDEETPPPALKQNVMAAIRNTRQLPSSAVVRDISSARSSSARNRGNTTERNRWVPALSAAAALAIFAGVGVGGWAIGQNSSDQEARQQLAASQAQQEAMLTIMNSPDAKIATSEISDGATVTVASSSKANKAAIMVNGMPPAPQGKIYELWFISAAGAVSAGMMDSNREPAMQILNGEMGGATHIGITVEPLGGSEKPTTTPILVQEI